MINKKALICGAGLLNVVTCVLAFIDTDRLCSFGDTICMRMWHGTIVNLYPIIPLFVFALITYFMREEVYRAWVKFAIPATLLSMLLIYLTPESSGGSGFGPQIVLGKGDTALVTAAIFVIVSIVIIAVKYFRLKR